ncbi:hypothetical protein PGAL8A_00233800 [Plasmodium gallinaceum]|uniref:Vesicle transport protein n=1 Tax=Plasmodium gallinaceum TaxID=5849 RepID=A0A1J1GR49_PLAGA|nr:hypothetical protein PGAL8A_00233800 [Plasmodium gallinaceum]CRG94940.1 hypothetical protein PGAL8A_00233800 [Plasmodium gallinaceum]
MHEYLLREHYNLNENNRENNIFENILTLSLFERIAIFIIFFLLGILFLFLSLGAIPLIIIGNVKLFAFRYSMGNIFLLFSFSSLLTPYQRSQNRNEEFYLNQKALFISYFVCIILNILSCLYFHSSLLIIVFIILQFFISILYIINRFPWIRNVLSFTTVPITT